MNELAGRFPQAAAVTGRALNQAARELLLAQASDWPFIRRNGTSSDYALKRVKDHLLRFIALPEQLTATRVDEARLKSIEWRDSIFPDLNYRYWAWPSARAVHFKFSIIVMEAELMEFANVQYACCKPVVRQKQLLPGK